MILCDVFLRYQRYGKWMKNLCDDRFEMYYSLSTIIYSLGICRNNEKCYIYILCWSNVSLCLDITKKDMHITDYISGSWIEVRSKYHFSLIYFTFYHDISILLTKSRYLILHWYTLHVCIIEKIRVKYF